LAKTKSKARDYRPTHVKRLFALSGNQCAAPNCTKALIARDEESVIAKICHIEAASSNGPRWNLSMIDDQRRHFDNLLLMCDECHTIIDNMDNEEKYPKELLVGWKKQHEDKLLYGAFDRQPSLLNIVISRLTEVDFDDEAESSKSANQSFQIEDKIKYNSIKRNKSLIDEFKIFNGKLNSLYQVLEKESAFKIERLLRNIKCLYIKTKGKYVLDSDNPLAIIQMHADDIFEDVEEELLMLVESSGGTYTDDITFGISVVMVDAFMRCKILEEPA
jgi:hypothetical protein